MKINVIVDGAARAQIEWPHPIEGIMPDDIRLARLLKANEALWKELVSQRIAATSFDGKNLAVFTKSGKPQPKANPVAVQRHRAFESDHPFLEACDAD